MSTYRIVRFFTKDGRRVLKTGLTLEEAKAHCNDPETSSRTCSNRGAMEALVGKQEWFDGYEEEL